MADMANVSGLQGGGEPEWTNRNTAGGNNFSRILLLAVGYSKYKGGVAPPCVNLKVVQPTLGSLVKRCFSLSYSVTIPPTHYSTFKHRDAYGAP